MTLLISESKVVLFLILSNNQKLVTYFILLLSLSCVQKARTSYIPHFMVSRVASVKFKQPEVKHWYQDRETAELQCRSVNPGA